jgi:hypothetical protein
MQQLIKMDISPAAVAKLRGVCHYSGHPLDSRFVTDSIVAQENVAQENVARANGTPENVTEKVLQEQK